MADKKEKNFMDYLKKISPGNPLRTVIDDLIRAGLGALIVFDSDEIQEIIEGGFRVNCRFTPQRLFELCKMDGGIVVSQDLKRILYANVLLIPDPTITSNETGTRHKSAERTAKQANTFVICVSERRKKTSLYYGANRYILKKSEEILREVSSNIQILEKQREIFNELINNLNVLEMSEMVSAIDVCKVIQRAEIIHRISDAIKKSFTELGSEGNIMHIRYKELIKGVEKTEDKILRDYSSFKLKKARTLLSHLSFDGLLDFEALSRLILEKSMDENMIPKGYRFLSHLSLNEKEVSIVVKSIDNITKIWDVKQSSLEPILKDKANKIKEEAENLKEQVLTGKVIY